MTVPTAARFTREEYLALPEAAPGFRFELVDGELVTMNDPLPIHQDAAGALYAELRAWCRAEPQRGRVVLPVDTELARDTIVGPDLQWFAADRDLPPRTTRPWPVGDIVVEIASPSTSRYDADVKLGRYLAAGAHEVWLVRTDPLGVRIVLAGEPPAGTTLDADGVLTSPLLPGFALPLSVLAE
ncbi:MAG: Uma2 family endonuclease [Solirubrobacteraceae bacterium]